MYDILTAILYGEPFRFRGRKALVPPCSAAEPQVESGLRKLDGAVAEALEKKVRAAVSEYRDQALLTGACSGAQLMAQLLSY